MRLAGVVLLLLGLVATVVATFSGCGSFFSWNGRHPIAEHVLGDGPFTQSLVPEPGRRYTLSVQVAFDRAELGRHEGVTMVEARMPLAVRVKDGAGTSLAELRGWLDPNEPPNVLFGQAARESVRRPMPELYVERLVGPFSAARDAPLSIEVNLGPDRVGTAHILARRLVVYDDALPSSIRNAVLAAAAGGLALVSGSVLLVIGWFRTRRSAPRRKGRGGNPHESLV